VKFLPMPEGTAEYRFGWSRFTAAEAKLSYSRPSPGISSLRVNLFTTGAVRKLWRMDTTVLLMSDLEASRPLRVRQIEQYGKRTVASAAEFAPCAVSYAKNRLSGSSPSSVPSIPAGFFSPAAADHETLRKLTGAKVKRFNPNSEVARGDLGQFLGHKRLRRSSPYRKDTVHFSSTVSAPSSSTISSAPTSEFGFKFPGVLDLQSALLFVRAQPLREGDVLRFLVFQDTAAYLAQVRVVGRERLTVPAGSFPAIRLDLSLNWVDSRLALQPHKNFKRATGWLSDDGDRQLLKVDSEVFVGRVWGELVRFVPATPSPGRR